MNRYILFFIISFGSFLPALSVSGAIPFDIYGLFALYKILSGKTRFPLAYANAFALSFLLVIFTSLRFAGDDLVPYFRIILTLLDGVGLFWVFEVALRRNADIAANLLGIFLGAYCLCFILWLMSLDADFFYFTNVKGWIASFPALLFMFFFLRNKMGTALLVAFVLIFAGIENRSRTLQLASILCLLFAVFKPKYRNLLIIFIPGSLIALIVGVPLLSQAASNTEDLSTIYRFYMTANLFDYSVDSLLFGVGVARWQADLSSFLSWTPNAEDFFEKRANPHFLPTEVLIYGGGLSLLAFIYVLHRSLRNSPIAPYLFAFFVASFFTTNTGVERVFLSITIFLAVWSSVLRYKLNNIHFDAR